MARFRFNKGLHVLTNWSTKISMWNSSLNGSVLDREGRDRKFQVFNAVFASFFHICVTFGQEIGGLKLFSTLLN